MTIYDTDPSVILMWNRAPSPWEVSVCEQTYNICMWLPDCLWVSSEHFWLGHVTHLMPCTVLGAMGWRHCVYDTRLCLQRAKVSWRRQTHTVEDWSPVATVVGFRKGRFCSGPGNRGRKVGRAGYGLATFPGGGDVVPGLTRGAGFHWGEKRCNSGAEGLAPLPSLWIESSDSRDLFQVL